MQAVLDIDVSNPTAVQKAVKPALRDSDMVQYGVDVDDLLHIAVSADRLGPLRGATNTAMMLIKLSENVLNYEE